MQQNTNGTTYKENKIQQYKEDKIHHAKIQKGQNTRGKNTIETKCKITKHK